MIIINLDKVLNHRNNSFVANVQSDANALAKFAKVMH